MEADITNQNHENPMLFIYLLSVLIGSISIYNYKPTLDFIFICLAIIGACINIYLGCKKIFSKKNLDKEIE